MISGIRLKICGLTSAADARLAAEAGADYLGFVLHPASPRAVTLEAFRRLAAGLPGPKVAVGVAPSAAELDAWAAAGADFFQVHFPADAPVETVRGWSEKVGRTRLWLAPRLPPGRDVPAGLLPLADVFLLDAYDPEKFGGTGRSGDWAAFARHRRSHPEKRWILSGGLKAETVAAALAATGADWIDVASGVESAPGVKDAARVAALVSAIRAAGTSGKARA